MDRRADAEFSAFVADRAGHLLHAAHLLTGDRHRAEDLVQTALTRTYARWQSVRDSDPEGYVRRVMVNAHTDWWRRRPWRETPASALPEGALPDIADRGAAGGDPAERAAAGDSALLLRALQTLPARQRAVLVLRYFEDLSEAEIAAALGCSPGTVKSAASRALAALRDDPAVSGLVAATFGAGPQPSGRPGGQPPASTGGAGRPPSRPPTVELSAFGPVPGAPGASPPTVRRGLRRGARRA